MLLEKGAKAEVSEIFERSNLKPKVHFTTWDDYAIMAMVVSGNWNQCFAGTDLETDSVSNCYTRTGNPGVS